MTERVVSDALMKALDCAAFSTAGPDDGTTPAGLLYGVTSLTPSAKPEVLDAMSDDLSALAAKINSANISTARLVNVCNEKQAVAMRARLSPLFTYTVLTTLGLAAGTVAAFAPAAIASAYEDPVSIEASEHAALVYEDATPGAPLADAPTRNMFQENSIALRIKARCAWAVRNGGASWVQGVSW
jgi:hypothetical protein